MNDVPQNSGGSPDTSLQAPAQAEDVKTLMQQREVQKNTPTETEKSLTLDEREVVADNSRFSALTIYSIILREGEEELGRPTTSLWWSGVAAGIGISTSVLAEGIIRANLPQDLPGKALIESLGYSFGFILVILSRLQLFTENTITVVLPLLARPTISGFYQTARLWAVVFAANMAGTFLTAAMSIYGGILSPDVLESILGLSRHLGEIPVMTSMLRGIPSGFFIAALVWMLPSAKGSEVIVIMLFTWLIAAGGFTHVVAGSNEIFNLVLIGEMGISEAFTKHILSAFVGNVLGGTGLFAMLAYGQIHKEISQ